MNDVNASRRRRPPLLATGALALCGVLFFAMPALPIEVQIDQLKAGGWNAANGGQTHDGNAPCNYIYVGDVHKQVLYYGTSGNCDSRVASHTSVFNQFHDLYLAMDKGLAGAINFVTKYYLQDHLGTSDGCITASAIKEKYTVYSAKMASKKDAATIESCVLAKTMGTCNRAGAGSRTATWQLFVNTLQGCAN